MSANPCLLQLGTDFGEDGGEPGVVLVEQDFLGELDADLAYQQKGVRQFAVGAQNSPLEQGEDVGTFLAEQAPFELCSSMVLCETSNPSSSKR